MGMKQIDVEKAAQKALLSKAAKQAIETALSAWVIDFTPTIVPCAFNRTQIQPENHEPTRKT